MKLLDDITSMDLRKVVERPNSQWVFVKATNVTFFVCKIKGSPIGNRRIITHQRHPTSVVNFFYNYQNELTLIAFILQVLQ